MSNDLDTARVQAINDLAGALLQAAGQVMKLHGPDPQGGVILSAGFSMALRKIGDGIDPTVPTVVREMLSQGAQSR